MNDKDDNPTFTWHVCEKCAIEIVKDCQDHERVIIRNPAYADGECSVCYGIVRFIVKVQKNTQSWLVKFTFNKKWKEYERSLTING